MTGLWLAAFLIPAGLACLVVAGLIVVILEAGLAVVLWRALRSPDLERRARAERVLGYTWAGQLVRMLRRP